MEDEPEHDWNIRDTVEHLVIPGYVVQVGAGVYNVSVEVILQMAEPQRYGCTPPGKRAQKGKVFLVCKGDSGWGLYGWR